MADVQPRQGASPAAAVGGPEALLATKLHLPGIRPGFVPRPRLADRLTAQGSGIVRVVLMVR